ncbi:MAG: nucleotide sugar dehydrogenase [Myxococcales bacterium]|nr:nucleotide sugar dehydrogenase [Myxococcales bacterium]
MSEKIAVVGLGYVGLPVAVACARHFSDTVGFDIQKSRIEELRKGVDRTGEVEPEALRDLSIHYTHDPEGMRDSTFFVVTVPTPIDQDRKPDLSIVEKASETVGRYLKKGDVVVYESTVYPGVTEELCGPILARVSGLEQGKDFKLGYSPERINPGDRQHTLERVVKIVAGEDEETLERVAAVYGAFVKAGLHRAPSIKVAEAAKVIENIQRDLNIALMNELALIFERLNIRTMDVLEAAGTKWNFLPFRPGLVGGHCIGVDPYYLTTKAEATGYHPAVILAGRRINDGMGAYVAQRMIKAMVRSGCAPAGKRVAVLGLTFKEDVTDLRNSRVPDIVHELRDFGVRPLVFDPIADAHEAKEEYGIDLVGWDELQELDGVILAVAHRQFREMTLQDLLAGLHEGGVVGDIKSVLHPSELPASLHYWSL